MGEKRFYGYEKKLSEGESGFILVVFLFDNDINIHLKDNATHVRYMGKSIMTLVVIANG